MKYEMHENLSLVLIPETREEHALVSLLEEMTVTVNPCAIHNAGMTYGEGRRLSLTLVFNRRKK